MNRYSMLKNHVEPFNVKHNLNLSKSLKAKLLYLGGNEFIRCKIDECWNDLILEDSLASEIDSKKDWDYILKRLKKRYVGYFSDIEEKMNSDL